jgi:hypothetical protein
MPSPLPSAAGSESRPLKTVEPGKFNLGSLQKGSKSLLPHMPQEVGVDVRKHGLYKTANGGGTIPPPLFVRKAPRESIRFEGGIFRNDRKHIQAHSRNRMAGTTGRPSQ